MPNKNFQEIPVTSWTVTDNDGTLVSLHSDPTVTRPSKEVLERIREYSFQNPEIGIMILSGRKDSELYDFYKNAFNPDPDGAIPKIVLASENGAYIRSAVKPDELRPQSEPLSAKVKESIKGIVARAAGAYYCDSKELNKGGLAVGLEIKDFGCTCHFRHSGDPHEMEKLADIKTVICQGFQELVTKDKNLHLDPHAASAVTLELVSKKITFEKLAKNKIELSGIVSRIPSMISYTGDDTGDLAVLAALSAKLQKNIFDGYTARVCNYSSTSPDVATRICNSPEETKGKENFYILGTNSKSAQQMTVEYVFDAEKARQMDTLRKELVKFGLISRPEIDVLPVVLLSTGDILIQSSEKYPHSILENLKDWTYRKIVLISNDQNSDEILKNIVAVNKNVTAVLSDNRGILNKMIHEVANNEKNLRNEPIDNTSIVSKKSENSNTGTISKIHYLRSIENRCQELGLLSKVNKEEFLGKSKLRMNTEPVASEQGTSSVQKLTHPTIERLPDLETRKLNTDKSIKPPFNKKMRL
ncbi:trehalose-phosphatase [Flavobacterium poyangense]|uniref:trehalose-phosphatase n=1 Tax=Flavobacterium poyangense TaxID=2204302 RepID=UPI00142186E4|nr:trehalose-phosphatase [Flavobacterium sp. JXAS1]